MLRKVKKLFWSLLNRKRRPVFDVFTPASEAHLTFVNRKGPQEELINSINTPGLQIVLYGVSGCGKTTLIMNTMKSLKINYIVSRCEVGTTLENLIVNAFDSLNPYFIEEKSSKQNSNISSEIKGDYKVIESKLSVSNSLETGSVLKRMIPPQLTPQRLADFFGEAQCCWIIEDFHKVKAEEKKRLSQIMKIFMDNGTKYRTTKIISIGAVGTARQILDYDRELNNRISEIFIPLMDKEELLAIIEKGEKIMNIDFSEGLRELIVNFSNGLPSVCHHLCLNACLDIGVNKTSKEKIMMNQFPIQNAVRKFIDDKSDTFSSLYDQLIEIDHTRLVITSIIRAEESGHTSSHSILEIIKQEKSDFTKEDFISYINKISELDSNNQFFRVENEGKKIVFLSSFFKVFFLMKMYNEFKEAPKVNMLNLDRKK